jgi:hypothetical protein
VDDDEHVRTSIEAAVEHWRAIWAPYGLTLSERYTTSAISPHLDFPSSENEALIAASATSEPGEITMLVGEDIDQGTAWLGMAGGIPGALVEGPRTGVIVGWLAGAGTNAEFSQAEIEILAGTMAHEIGHFQGLIHPVETAYDGWDALDDTPECRNRNACEEELGNNLMFPYTVSGIGAQEDLTSQQNGVIQRYVGSP